MNENMNAVLPECCRQERRVRIANAKVRIRAYFGDVAGAAKMVPYIAWDVAAAIRKDPALRSNALRYPEVLLYPGIWALFLYRVAHVLHVAGLPFIPRLLSQLARLFTGIEIHPGARIGKGLFIDHGMGIVIGETAETGRNVTMYHGVTLGGVSGETGKRHPTVGDEVLLGAGAKILGNILIGSHSRIGAQAVVLKDVPEGATAAGVPATIRR